MRLRKQLVILSLITLIIPWMGCQYLRELQTTLDSSEVRTMQVTGDAISALLANDPLTRQALLERVTHSDSALYAHRLNNEITLDGYDEEWQTKHISFHELSTHHYDDITIKNENKKEPNFLDEAISQKKITPSKTTNFSAKVAVGYYKKSLFIYFLVEDTTINYAKPLLKNNNIEGSSVYDRIFLYLSDNENKKIFEISASAPGRTRAQNIGNSSQQLEFQIRGQWLENNKGYQVELELPKNWAENGLRLEVENSEDYFYASSSKKSQTSNNPFPKLITQSTVIDDALNVFTKDNQRIKIVDFEGRLIAENQRKKSHETEKTPWIIRLFYQWLLSGFDNGNKTKNEHIDIQGTEKTIRTKNTLFLNKSNNNDDAHNFYIEIDKSNNVFSSLTNNAFSRLIIYSILITFAVALSLVIYASWLSWRIKKVSSAAQSALIEKGSIKTDFPTFKIHDEISELSQNYERLLKRLDDYTRYLQTLSSKLSHELRTPLAIVSSSLDNLSFVKLDNEAQIYTQRANDGTKRLSAILTALSSATRIEQAIHSADKTPCNLRDLLPDLNEAYKSAYPQSSFCLTISSDETPLMVLASPELIVQMLDKLIANAVDFCLEEGTITLAAHANGQWVNISIENPGPLLPENVASHLFDSLVSERNHQHNESNDVSTAISKEKNTNPHLGLGLYIVRLIANFHDGSVEAKNLEDAIGVRFTIKLPRYEACI